MLKLVHDLTTPHGWERYKQNSRFNYNITMLKTTQEAWQTSGDPRLYRAWVARQEWTIGLASTDSIT